MGTRGAIGVMHGDKAKVIYCHWDSYLEGVGRILFDHYDSPKANYLVALGGISSLGKVIGEQHPFSKNDIEKDDPEAETKLKLLAQAEAEDWTTFYGRDRGESGNEYVVCNSDEEMYEHFSWCEYFYIMRDGVWYVSQGPDTKWQELAVALAELDIENAEDALPDESVLIKQLVGA